MLTSRKFLENYVGKKVRIISMAGEPSYHGRVGVVFSVDDAGQLHGTWGGCAITSELDSFELIEDENCGSDD